MSENRLTEKRMSDKRFRRTEEAILTAFFSDNNFMSTKQIAERAGVAPSTFYRHHATIKKIAKDYEDFIMRRYYRMMTPHLRRKNEKVQQIFLRVLIFIIANKHSLLILQKSEDKKVMERMVMRLRPRMLSYLRIERDDKKIFNVYVAEIVAVLVNWWNDSFNEKEVDKVLRDIMYLTDTARVRLRPLMLKKD